MAYRRVRKLGSVVLAVAAAGILSACASTTSGTTLGRFVAPETGGNRGTQSISAAMGGGLIGDAIGGLDERDRRRALEAEYKALEYSQAGQAVNWQGSSGTGEVIAYQPYRVGSQDCRQYSHTVLLGGQSRSFRGSACRNDDGSWTPLV